MNTTLEQLKILLLSQGYLHLQLPLLDVVDPLPNKILTAELLNTSSEYTIQDKVFIDNLNHSNYVNPNVVFNLQNYRNNL